VTDDDQAEAFRGNVLNNFNLGIGNTNIIAVDFTSLADEYVTRSDMDTLNSQFRIRIILTASGGPSRLLGNIERY
jgi:hypothetical protein